MAGSPPSSPPLRTPSPWSVPRTPASPAMCSPGGTSPTILTEELFQAYPNAVINIHPSLIPSFCGVGCYGLHVHEKALEYGVKISGATVHFVTEECDAGPIILQKAAEVLPGDTPEVLQRRIMEQCEWKLLPQAVSLFCQDRLKVEGRAVRILDCL